MDRTQPPTAPGTRPRPIWALLLVTVVVMGLSLWANLSFAVTNKANYRYFPPFEPNVNRNKNDHLGAEYLNIARAIVKGEGFANPFTGRTGPTAWMPPVLSTFQAGLWWASDGDRTAVMTAVICCQVLTLIATGWLVVVLAWQTGARLGAGVAAVLFTGGLLAHFYVCFQMTHDSWLVLLALDLFLAGYCWCQPLQRRLTAIVWGLLGGFCALVNPIVAVAWGAFSMQLAHQQRAWPRLALAVLAAGLTLTPWTVRNYVVFGRLIPVKSNMAYELYQSQCLQPDGLIQVNTFRHHPYNTAGPERLHYQALGEMAYLDRKGEQFWSAVRADPLDFLDRAVTRFLGATLWYVPYDRDSEFRRPVILWLSRLVHPLPFLAVLVMVGSAFRQPLQQAQQAGLGVYLLYLLPYIAVSYYERYATPLLGVKVLLVLWAADRLWSRGSQMHTAADAELPEWEEVALADEMELSYRGGGRM